MTTTMRRLPRTLVIAAALLGAGCNSFNVEDPNQPLLSSITQNPNQANLSSFAVGIFQYSRQDMQEFIWRVGSMGREGVNLSGNNQPDYGEPYYGPLTPSGFGGALWAREYTTIRNANIFIDAIPKASPRLASGDSAAAIGFAQYMKALMFLYLVETRAQLGAPIDVDRPVTATPAPFVHEDSVYATIIHTLDSARVNLALGNASFFFPVPPGYTADGFGTPAGLSQVVSALEAKAWVLRATDDVKGAPAGGAASCYNAALTVLATSFYSPSPSNFAQGVYFDFSSGAGDTQNGLSEPLTGPIYFSLVENDSDAQQQVGGGRDARALAKIDSIPVGQSPQVLGGIPIQGDFKFVVYYTQGQPNTAASIPIIRDEELVLLHAEAELGLGQFAVAENDINLIRTASGNLPALAPGASADTLFNELLYNRRYSLLWEQGTRWIDARRYGVLSTIPAEPYAPTPWTVQGNVPTVMPIPQDECEARNLGSTCDPLGT